MQTHRFLPILLAAACTLPATFSHAQDATLCRAVCSRDKDQCRSGLVKPDLPGVLATVGAVGLLLSQAVPAPLPMSAVHDMRPELAGKQQAADALKQQARERDDNCNRVFGQCLVGCASEVPPAAPSTPSSPSSN